MSCYDVTQTNTDGFHWNSLGCRYTRNSSHVVLMEIYTFVAGFPRGTVVKNLPANTGDARDVGSIPGLGRSRGEGNGQHTPVFLPGESHGQRSPAGYSPRGHESDVT